MKLYGVTTVFNEEPLIPIVMPYLEKMGYDKLVVLDNESTDNTVELLSKYPFVEIRSYKTDFFHDRQKINATAEVVNEFLTETRNNNDGEQVWVTINDFDEVFEYHVPKNSFLYFKYYLKLMGEQGYQQCREHLWYLMENGESVHYGEPFFWNKPNLFRVDGLDYLNIGMGQHDSYSQYDKKEPKIFYGTKILSAFHLKYYNKKLFLNRQIKNAKRGFGVDEPGDTIAYVPDINENMDEYDERLKLSIPYSEYFSNKILNGKDYIGNFNM